MPIRIVMMMLMIRIEYALHEGLGMVTFEENKNQREHVGQRGMG